MTAVVVVEDHTLVRQSLVKIVAAEPGFKVVGETGRGDEAVDLVKRHSPDIVLLDIELPGEDGVKVASELRRLAPDTRILFLTMHIESESVRRAVAIGDGYVPKTASTEELVEALRVVAGGGSYLSPSLSRSVMDIVSGKGHPADLTDRELEILRLLASGLRSAEVADRLSLSNKTVKNHLTNIYAKLGVETAAQAVAEAFRLAIVSAHGD